MVIDRGSAKAVAAFVDPVLEVPQEGGLAHERAYLGHLRDQCGLAVVDLDDVGVTQSAFEKTVAGMREGADAIAQATLIDGRWHGRADVLLRRERPSRLGPWSYEVVDTKLAL